MSDGVSTDGFGLLLGVTIVAYVIAMYGLSLWVRGRVRDVDDFLVAGRRLPLSLAWMTLLATWFGAGTILTAADEVRQGGLQRAALDPLGAGVCLLLAGLLIARRLWRMKLLTLSDFFRRRYGPGAELMSAGILVPSYFGWIAVQFVALAGMLELFFGLDPRAGILLVALVGMGYTLLGGMWSVTITDVVQISLVLVGLGLLTVGVLVQLGDGSPWCGLSRLVEETPPPMLRPLPIEDVEALIGWLAVFCTGALGNLPAQDLLQRIFAARSERVAQRACLVAGGMYLSFGMLPVGLGLAANLLLPSGPDTSVLPALARSFLSPVMAVVFIVALLSAVLSTIDSAILAPSGVLAQNVLGRWNAGRWSPLTLNRLAVLLVTAASLVVSYLGESAYSLLEGSYELVFAALFVPLILGLYREPRDGRSAVVSMTVGSGLWLVHLLCDWKAFLEPWPVLGCHLPASPVIVTCSLVAYLVCERFPASPGQGGLESGPNRVLRVGLPDGPGLALERKPS